MRIEDEIKQKQFVNEYHKVGINILYTGSWLRLQNLQALKAFGISPEQYNILRILKGQHPHPSTVNLLIERMIDKSSNASRIVEKLREKGLVERRNCEKDRRQVDVHITQKGLDLINDISKSDIDFSISLSKINEAEAKALNDILDKLRG
jgi:DNA-binding MarR family transcriptional regulator